MLEWCSVWDSILGSVLHCVWAQGGIFHRIPGHRRYYNNNLSQLRFDIQGDRGEVATGVIEQAWTTFQMLFSS